MQRKNDWSWERNLSYGGRGSTDDGCGVLVAGCSIFIALYAGWTALKAVIFMFLWNLINVSGVINTWADSDIPNMTFKVAFVIVLVLGFLFGGSSSRSS